jgi:hypothetical protein
MERREKQKRVVKEGKELMAYHALNEVERKYVPRSRVE